MKRPTLETASIFALILAVTDSAATSQESSPRSNPQAPFDRHDEAALAILEVGPLLKVDLKADEGHAVMVGVTADNRAKLEALLDRLGRTSRSTLVTAFQIVREMRQSTQRWTGMVSRDLYVAIVFSALAKHQHDPDFRVDTSHIEGLRETKYSDMLGLRNGRVEFTTVPLVEIPDASYFGEGRRAITVTEASVEF